MAEEQEKEHKGGVVVLTIPDSVSEEICLEKYGYEKQKDLHITLGYIYYRNFERDVWFDLVYNSILRTGFPSGEGTLGKLMNFELSGSDQSDYALVIGVNIFQIDTWRERFKDKIKSKGLSISNKFHPHITLAYYNDRLELNNIDIKSQVELLNNPPIDFGLPEIWIDKDRFSFTTENWTFGDDK